MQLVFSHAMYRVSTCFSAHDIPNTPNFAVGERARTELANFVAGTELWCYRTSKSGGSGWFQVELGEGTVSLVIHSRFLERVGFNVVSTYSYEYYESTPERAMAAARRKFPNADHRHGY